MCLPFKSCLKEGRHGYFVMSSHLNWDRGFVALPKPFISRCISYRCPHNFKQQDKTKYLSLGLWSSQYERKTKLTNYMRQSICLIFDVLSLIEWSLTIVYSGSSHQLTIFFRLYYDKVKLYMSNLIWGWCRSLYLNPIYIMDVILEQHKLIQI